MTDWVFHQGAQVWSVLSIVTAIFILLAAIYVHWPSLSSSTVLNRQELESLRGTHQWRRFAMSLLLLASVVAAVLAVLMLVADFRPALTIALISRAHCQLPLTPDGRPEPDFPSTAYDLGPKIDEVLSQLLLLYGNNWSGSPQEYELIRKVVLEEVSHGRNWALRKQIISAPLTSSSLPPWVVETVEISMVNVTLKSQPVRMLYVSAGAPAPGTGGWPLAAVAMRDDRLRVYAPRVADDPQVPRIVRFLSAEYRSGSGDGSAGTVRYRCVVAGAGAPTGKVKFRLISPSTAASESNLIAEGSLDIEAASGTTSESTSNRSPWFRREGGSLEILKAPPAGSRLVDEYGATSIEVRFPDDPYTPKVWVESAEAGRWEDFVTSISDSVEYRALVRELSQNGLRLPAFGSIGEIEMHIGEEYLILGRRGTLTPELIAMVGQMRSTPQVSFYPPEAPYVRRIRTDHFFGDDNDIFSFTSLTLRQDARFENVPPRYEQLSVSDLRSGDATAAPHWTGVQSPVAVRFTAGNNKFAAILLGQDPHTILPAPNANGSDPFLAGAVLRAITWLSVNLESTVADSRDNGLEPAELSNTQSSTNCLRRDDCDEIYANTRRLSQSLALIVYAIYWSTLAFFVRRRTAPPTVRP